ncbi:cyclin-like protein [Xylariomycetidae sp. FL2044]|nr:cyclin-like protein [Xylariomycetidae sp. FL2044]
MPGGVCAVLDYETDLMADYVAEMAMRIVIPNGAVTGAFRKFVNQILTSTRLPSTTILLGMNYLAKRVNTLSQATAFKASEGQVWKMLTVALLLGSKFLDDNTFQNRSWSDVSGIAVGELNIMEDEWLQHIGWVLYVNLDRSHDYNAWLKNWREWQEAKQLQKQQQQQQQQQQQAQAAIRERLAPIVTSVRPEVIRQHHPLVLEGYSPEEIAEQETLISNRFGHIGKTAYRHEGDWRTQYQQSTWQHARAPLTPPDSGYGTPEYLNSAASINSSYNEWFNHNLNHHNASKGNYSRGYGPFADQAFGLRGSSHYQQPYLNHFNQNGWDSSVADCDYPNCASAMHHKAAPYFHQQHGYRQPVMG